MSVGLSFPCTYVGQLLSVPQLQSCLSTLCGSLLLFMCWRQRQRAGLFRSHPFICRDLRCVLGLYISQKSGIDFQGIDLDTFFDNVCELDLVFNFYKVYYSVVFCTQWHPPIWVIFRFMRFWTKFSLPERLKRQAKMLCSWDWRNWRNWSELFVRFILARLRFEHCRKPIYIAKSSLVKVFTIILCVRVLLIFVFDGFRTAWLFFTPTKTVQQFGTFIVFR